MENGAIAPRIKCSIFHNISKYVAFQRCKKALLWSKGLIDFGRWKSRISMLHDMYSLLIYIYFTKICMLH